MYRVIIVDDEELIRSNLEKAVPWEELDCQVCGTFKNGQVALEYIRTNGADMVITDIRMPAMDGIELAKALSTLIDPPLIIFLTGYGEFDYAREAIRYGVFDYILKPIDYDELADAVYSGTEKLSRSQRFCGSATAGLLYDLITGGELLLDPPPRLDACACLELMGQDDETLHDSIESWFETRRRLRPLIYSLSLEKKTKTLIFLDSSEEELERAIPYLIEELRELLPEGTRLALGGFSSLWQDLPSLRAKAQEKLNSVTDDIPDRRLDPSFDRTDRMIEKTEEYILAHYTECIGVEQIADAMKISVGYLCTQFKARYGITILKRLTSLRIEKTQLLLRDPWLRAHEIATLVGYRDYRYFSQVFKKNVGCTLMEFRSRLNK